MDCHTLHTIQHELHVQAGHIFASFARYLRTISVSPSLRLVFPDVYSQQFVVGLLAADDEEGQATRTKTVVDSWQLTGNRPYWLYPTTSSLLSAFTIWLRNILA